MAQALYALLAVMLLGTAVLTVNLKIHGTEERLVFSELALGMTNVGAELLSEIGRYPYDPVALSTTTAAVLNNPAALRDASTFGVTSPCNPDAAYAGCLFINDFHGKTAARQLVRTHNGVSHTVTYNVAIAVRYADEASPHGPAAGRTFAKRVTLTLSTPVLTSGPSATPVEIQMSRVYTYPSF